MVSWGFAIAGALFGLAGCAPAVLLLEGVLRERVRAEVGWGLAAVAVSFVALSAAVAAVRLLSPDDTLAFGTSMAGTFLAVWALESLRASRDVCGATRGRKEG